MQVACEGNTVLGSETGLTPADQDAPCVLFAGHDLLVGCTGRWSVLALAPRAPAAAHLSLLGNDRVLRVQHTKTCDLTEMKIYGASSVKQKKPGTLTESYG
jgi:hypothetical protein